MLLLVALSTGHGAWAQDDNDNRWSSAGDRAWAGTFAGLFWGLSLWMLGASLSADNPDTYDQEWVNTQGFDLLTEPWAIGLGVGGLVLGGTLGALLCDTTDRRDQFILVHSFILLAQGALLLSGWNQQTEYGAFEDADAMFFIGSVPWLVMEVGVMALFLALVRDTPTSEEEGSNEGSLWIEMAPASLTIRF